MRKLTNTAILLYLSYFLCVGRSVAGEAPAVAGKYVVVVSQSTNDTREWKPVVEALTDKYEGSEVVLYAQSIDEALDSLRHHSPRWTCFVAQPEEATQAFVAQVHQLTRKLDDDPFTDTFWGILTGYDAQNALQIAKHQSRLVIRKVASGTEVALDCCEQGLWYDELVQGKMVRKRPGEPMEQLQGPDDTTAALVDSLNEYKADLFVTSGHATERDWQIGFCYRNGVFRCSAGRLFGLDTSGNKYPIDSPNPKVYLPIGNCLMGHIDGLDAMALAWLNSAGVKQMMGYTVPTWYGYAGWGCLDYFVEQPGRYTFVEAFFANQHALIRRLADDATSRQDKRGLAFDQDVVALYGDPAWEARMAPQELSFETLHGLFEGQELQVAQGNALLRRRMGADFFGEILYLDRSP